MAIASATRASLGTAPGRRRLVGHALALRHDAFAVMDAARGHDIAVLRLGPKPAYVISHPELIRHLLTTADRYLDKGPLYENLAQLIGVSVGTLTGDAHRARRRLVAPAYRPNIPIMSDCAARLVRSWVPGRVYDMSVQMRRYSFLVKARTLFDDTVSAADEAEFVELLPVALAGIARWMVDPTGLVKRLPTRNNRRVRHALTRLKRIIEQAVDAYRSGRGGSGGILAALADAHDPTTRRPLSAEAVRDEAMVLMSAGSETVGGLLSHACDLLARDRDIARRLGAEADRVIGGLPVTEEHLADLELTTRVVTELLRLFPPGALMSRRASVELRLGGQPIPAGAALFFCPYLLHRRPGLYPDPDRFDPDRWLPDRADALPRGAFLPFGAGPHRCLGERIAWPELVVAVATISRLRRLAPAPGAAGRPPRPVLAPTLGLDAVPVTVDTREDR